MEKFDWFMLGHRVMTSQEVQGQDIFERNIAHYCTLEGDIDHDEASLDYFR